MIKKLIVLLSCGIFILGSAFLGEKEYSVEELRALYSGDPSAWPAPHLHPQAREGFRDIGALPKPVYPASNPYSPEKKKLGKMLFFDPRLSSSKQIACASCHDPELGWGDGRHLAFGHDRKTGKRNAMTLFNVAFYESFFWDGRAKSLEDQVKFPISDHVEMNMNLDTMVVHISQIKGYAPFFKAAFGSEEVSLERIQQSIATFERSIVSNYSRFDSFVKGNAKAMSDDEVRGMHLFRTKAKCINCHNSPLFSDNRFHNDGQTLLGSKFRDLGRYQVTGHLDDVGKFRTPSLRETSITGPWMHHGNFPSLRDVIEFYNLGNPVPDRKSLAHEPDSLKAAKKSPMLTELFLSEAEKDDLEAFLHAISTRVQKSLVPELPR